MADFELRDSAKRVLVLAGGLPQGELARRFRSRGYTVFMVDYNKCPVGASEADYFFRESTLDLDAVRSIARENDVGLVATCCTDQAVATMAIVSDELGLPCYLSAESALDVTNKSRMKQIFADRGIPTASHTCVCKGEDLHWDVFPAVVKPADCNSSKGVLKVSNRDELVTAVEDAFALSRTSTAIVEQYIDGVEYSIDAFVVDGEVHLLCVSRSDKLPCGDGFVICRGIYVPEVHCKFAALAQGIAQQIADAFGLINCPLLVQVLERDGDLFVVEFSARTGGCVKYRLIDLAAGFDVLEATVDVLEGKTPPVSPVMSDCVISNEFFYASSGDMGSLVGYDQCLSQGLLENYYQLKAAGEHVGGINNSGNRVAAATIVAASLEDYRNVFERLSEQVDILDSDGRSIIRRDLLTCG